MKKMLKAFIFVLALVVFAGTVSAEEINENGLQNENSEYSLTINFVDDRLGTENKAVVTYKSNTTTTTETYTFLSLSSDTNYSFKERIDGKENLYTFNYWAQKIESGRTYKKDRISYIANKPTVIDGINIYSVSKQQSKLIVIVPELTENKEITLYSNWSTREPGIIINVHDNKAYNNKTAKEIYTNENANIKLSEAFLNDTSTNYLTYSNTDGKLKINKTASYYLFSKYLDEDGNEIDNGYSSDIINSVEFYENKKIGNNTYLNYLTLKFNKEYISGLTEDITYNIYVEWEEHTTAILTHEYIDYVSDGDGSWSNPTGGTASYTHTFSDPSVKSPRSHYKFLYWQFEQSTPADDQVDTTKKYEAGEEFTYTLSGKPSGWKGKVTSYAWWQPDVTVNLYSDGRLFSSKSSFESVSIEETPVKFGYKFLGWFDEDGNKVTETIFSANKAGTNPEVKEITLYARFERIMVDVKVSKVWDDENNNDGKRPTSVTVELKDGDKVVETAKLSKDNNWTYTFNVAKFNDKDEIAYTVSENEVKDYTTVITGTVKDGFVITNTHEVEIIENVSVKKVWNDKNNEDEIRPSSVTIYLLANGEKVAEVVLNEENNWKASFENLKVYEDGEEIEYTISENEIEYYTTEIIGSLEKGFVITNTHEVWPKGQGGDDFEVVQTGSEYSLSLSFILLFIELLIVRKKRLS